MQDLSGLYISESFQNLVQRSASGAFNVLGTATGTEFVPVSASYAISSSHADNTSNAISSSYAVSSSYALKASTADSATTAISASHAVNADIAISSSYADFAEDAGDLVITVKNVSGGTLAKGTAVHATGVTGENVNVVAASNDSATDMPAIGILNEQITNNANGQAIISGRIIGIDTSTLIAGAAVYVNTNGGFTAVKPTGSSLIQNIGVAAKINSSDGEIIVQGSGRTNDLPNLTTNYLWLGDTNGVPQAVPSSSLSVATAISASHAVNADSAISASHALNADNAVSSSYALTASFATNAAPPFPFTGSAQITGSLGVTGSMIVSRNEPGVNATLIIRDDAQSSFNDGPTLTFEGSNVGIIKSQAATNMQIKAERDLEIFVGQGGAGSQFKIVKADNQGGDYTIADAGSRRARYDHLNLSETGSIKFRHNGFDNGIAIEMNDNRMALEMYSGSAFVPIIERKVNTREINLYDSTFNTGSSGQVLTSNAQGGIAWAAGGGGGGGVTSVIAGTNITLSPVSGLGDVTINSNQVSASYALSSSQADVAISSSHAVNSDSAISSSHALNADNAISSSYALTASYAANAGDAFPYTGSAKITGSLEVVGPTTFKGGVIQTDIGFSTYFGLNSGTAALANPTANKFSTAYGVGTLAAATGTENAAFGGDTLLNNTGGSRNAAYGQAGLKANLNGGNNSSLGWNTLSNITAGDSNTAMGAEAGRVIVGGANNTNSAQSTFLGSGTKPLNTGENNQIVIGFTAEGQGSNTVVLGNTSIVSTQLRGNVNTTGSLKVRGPGDFGGANGANTVAAGAAISAGSSNTVNSTDAGIVAGNNNTVSGDNSVIVGGEGNNVNSGYTGIFGAASSTITNADTSVILGGYQQALQGTRTYLLGGNNNQITNAGAEFSGIVGGEGHRINTATTASVILGGRSITATKNNHAYVPELEVAVVGGGITMYSPNGTEFKLTVSDAGALVIT